MPPLPDALGMRALKYAGAPEAERESVAHALRAAGRHTEALLLYEGRAGHPSLAAAKQRAVSQGLSFALFALRRLGREVSEADVRECARAAEQAGRWLDARQCLLALGESADVQDGLQRIAPHLPASLRPPPPPPLLPASTPDATAPA